MEKLSGNGFVVLGRKTEVNKIELKISSKNRVFMFYFKSYDFTLAHKLAVAARQGKLVS